MTEGGSGPAEDGGPGALPVRIAHLCRGRARLRAEGRPGAEAMTRAADALAAGPGVRRVLARPATGSLIVEAEGEAEALRGWLERCAALRILPHRPPPPVGQAAQLGLLRLDAGIRGRTEGALDFRTALALLLLAAAVVQLSRGQVAGPATTLMMSALSLLESRKG